jgi:hypothetical protein
LNGDVVRGDEAGDIAAGLDKFVVGAEAERPVFLKVAGIRGSDADGGGELKERGAGENLEDRRDDEPRGDNEPKCKKRAGLVETFGLGGGGRRVRSRGR